MTNPYIKKARESVLVTRPTLRGSRIAQPVWTSNAEIAHADMYNNKAHLLLRQRCTIVITYPVDIHRCFCFDYDQKFAKFLEAKDKNVVNVFS